MTDGGITIKTVIGWVSSPMFEVIRSRMRDQEEAAMVSWAMHSLMHHADPQIVQAVTIVFIGWLLGRITDAELVWAMSLWEAPHG